MDICLHIGPHRSATTTFQVFLRRHSASLRKCGIVAWGPDRTRAGLFAGLTKNPAHLMPSDNHLAQQSLGRLHFECSRTQVMGVDHLLLSEENMIGTMDEVLGTATLYPFVRARLARFAGAFGGKRVRIGLGVRSYETYWASALAFKMNKGWSAPNADHVDRLAAQPRRWRDVICDVAAAFEGAEIVVWPFEEYANRPDLQLSALSGASVIPCAYHGAATNNAALPAVELSKKLRTRGENLRVPLPSDENGRYMPFTRTQIDKLRQDYRDDIAWLRAGADGNARYIGQTGGTSGGLGQMEGSHNERRQESLGRAG